MIQAQKSGDSQTVHSYLKSLALQNPEQWFASVFGNQLGSHFEGASERSRAELEATATGTIGELAKHRKKIAVLRFDEPCNPAASATEYPVLVLRQRLEPLYAVRVDEHQATDSDWSFFAYVNGGFRFIGQLMVTPAYFPVPEESAAGNSTPKVPVVQAPDGLRPMHFVGPDFPKEFRYGGNLQPVLLHAILATDGSVKQLDLVSGACLVATPAMEAVRQWRFPPQLSGGSPAEAEMMISVRDERAYPPFSEGVSH